MTTADDTDVHPPRKLRRRWIVLAVVAVILAGGAVVAEQTGAIRTGLAWWDSRNLTYPDVDTAQLSPVQQRIVDVTRAEYDAQPAGTKYSQGVEEEWCADFVSWVMRSAGREFSNPNSGSWRIPGVYTLTEYFQAEKRFRPAGSGYTPKLGDVMLYGHDSPFRQHTNIVLTVDDGVVTTVGGNEWGGHVRISRFDLSDRGLVGIGVL
ncbi:CHAP domain-containing protein [Gordonia sp. PDNC005]|uniref:CHAP domain-containing protein n=1 Tax=unclassified Gordonia (in: high G+C Gram-positive bacteria) TaxID=2657482 RepID=UPI0019646689|nr:CHAP domain-containing protein [Gordonia sp. PDNC005]QRY62157.1 CHAP domain-containing protein [Gordonia sp. PDNC005]